MNFCPKCGTRLTEKSIEGRLKKACPSGGCGYVFWDNPVPVVAAVVENDKQVVLVRNKGWPEKMFGLVSGFLERGESPADAVLREVREELGLEGKIDDFIGVYSFFEMNQLLLVYHVSARGEISLGDELEAFRRVAPKKLVPWPIGTGPAVRDWLVRKGLFAP
ncbi:MAG TPA: NUDIX domain-containing protein [Desulfomonilia bacterium]|nr:NUDIX domain-containing protein [Desulfomonilia bacterium]